MFNYNELLKSIFPIGLTSKNDIENIKDFNGTAFLVNCSGFLSVITAYHCVSSIAKYRFKVTSEDNITTDMIKKVLEDNINFGYIKSNKQIYSIPISNIFRGISEVGNNIDTIICKVNETDMIKNNNTSLSDLKALEISTNKLIIGNYYEFYGFPNINRDKINKIIYMDSRKLKLIKLEPKEDYGNAVYGYLDITHTKDTLKTIEGFSGSPLFDSTGKIVGILEEINENDKHIRFIALDTIIYFMTNIIKNNFHIF